MFSNSFRGFLFVALTVLSFETGLRGQNATAQLSGSVRDSSGAAVPGAVVKTVNTGQQVETKTETNADGIFNFPVLQPGEYRVSVTKEGFQQAARPALTLEVGQTARLDFSLIVGSSTQTMEVSGQALLLESDTASTGQFIGTKPINDLPLNGRNFLQLAKLSVGVTEAKQGDRASAGGSFIANGVRAQFNNFQLDGVDNNAKIVDQQNSSPVVIQPSVDALQEFRVETNNYSAEYGYSAGAVVNATIKSGTNGFHGDAFEFLRNNALDARNYFSNPAAPKPVLQQNQFGGILGGPIVRNRAFLFGSWERTSVNRGSTLVTTVPTAALKLGNFAGQPTIYDPATTTLVSPGVYSRTPFPNNQIPLARFDPAALKLLQAEPLPNNGNATSNFVVSPTNDNRANRGDFRQDTQISQADSLFARYSFFSGNSNTYGPFPAPLVGSSNFQTAPKANLGNGAAVGETHIFKPTLVNEFRLGYNRIQDFLSSYVKTDVNSQFGLGGIPVQAGVTGLASIGISGFAALGEATFLPNLKISEVFTAEDHLSWTLGKHLIKFGGSYRWVRSWFNISSNARGSYNFSGAFTQNPQRTAGTGSGLADFVLGIPANSTISNSISGDLRYNYGGAFIQDDWKVSQKLTLNLGLRYEIWTPPVERHDQQANFLTSTGKLIFAKDVVPPGVPLSLTAKVPDGLGDRSLERTFKANFAPRLGAAFQATGHTVIRAGAGLFYADDPAIGASSRLVANPPYFRILSFQTDQINPILQLSSGFPADALSGNVNLSAAGFSSFATDLKQGYVLHWSGGVQHQAAGYLFEGNYVGTKGTDLPASYNVNAAFAGPGSVASRRPYQGLGDITFTSPFDTSVYHAFQARVEHRYANGISLLVSYTLSKTIDNGGEQLIGDLNVRDARNLKAERALSSGDERHRFVTSALYDLPIGRGRRFEPGSRILNTLVGGWQVNGLLTAHTGQPFTPALGTSSANTGAARPNRNADGNLDSNERSVGRWFDKTAFSTPASYLFGNAGRNILIGPGAVNLDASLFKSFGFRRLGERGEIQFRAEFFNSLNHPQFAQPNNRVDLAQGATITALSNNMREIQFALKITAVLNRREAS